MSQAQLAAKVGVRQNTIAAIETGATKRTKYLADLARALDVAVGELDTAGPPPPGMREDPGNYRQPPEFLGERDLKVFAAVEGGPGEMVVSTDPIEYVPRPWYMREVRDGYAVLVVGESMEPVFSPGDMAIVNPRLPPMRGKDVILVSGEEEGEFRASIKRLQRWDAKNWHVQQFNPARVMAWPKKDWPKALRVVGKYYGG